MQRLRELSWRAKAEHFALSSCTIANFGNKKDSVILPAAALSMQQVWCSSYLLLDRIKVANKSTRMSRNAAAVIGQELCAIKVSNEFSKMAGIAS